MASASINYGVYIEDQRFASRPPGVWRSSSSQSVQLELLTALEEEVRYTEIREMSETSVAVQVLPSPTRQDLDVNGEFPRRS